MKLKCTYLEQIHDGPTSGSYQIGRFCGNRLPKGGNIVSTHNALYLWFRSDSSLAKEGFELHWTSIAPGASSEFRTKRFLPYFFSVGLVS